MAPDKNTGSSWDQWSTFVLRTIEKLEERVDMIEQSLHKTELEIQKELVQLKTKASFAGALFGLVTSIIVSIVSGLILFAITTGMKKDAETQPAPRHYQSQQDTRQPIQQQNPVRK